MTTDAFAHLPGLRGRVTLPEQSELRVTPAVLALWDERARELGRPADWRLADQELEDTRRALLGDFSGAKDLWIYSYGSLMWDPGFHFAEVRLADLTGFRRRFSYRTTLGRGTPERPALMLSLERGGDACCKGLAFRIASGVADAETAVVWRREMIRGGYRPTMLPVSTPQGEVMALVFATNPEHADYVGELPLDETAAIIAQASGILGSNRHYLERVAAQLEHLEIEDDYVRHLAERVRMIAEPQDPPAAPRTSELEAARPASRGDS